MDTLFSNYKLGMQKQRSSYQFCIGNSYSSFLYSSEPVSVYLYEYRNQKMEEPLVQIMILP